MTDSIMKGKKAEQTIHSECLNSRVLSRVEQKKQMRDLTRSLKNISNVERGTKESLLYKAEELDETKRNGQVKSPKQEVLFRQTCSSTLEHCRTWWVPEAFGGSQNHWTNQQKKNESKSINPEDTTSVQDVLELQTAANWNRY